jgi:DNA-binding GntR family transcriptional regulator
VDHLNRPTTTDLVLEQLRHDIVTGALPPGGEIKATLVASQLGVSHIPVREALRALANEGLVTLRAQQRARVATIAVEDVQDVYHLRILLEGDLVERAAPQYSDAQLEQLSELFRRMGSTGSTEDLETHDAFHRLLVEPAASEWDMRVLRMLWTASERHLRFLFAAFRPGDAQYEHDVLLQAAQRRDGPALRAALVAHLEKGLVLLRARFEIHETHISDSIGQTDN